MPRLANHCSAYVNTADAARRLFRGDRAKIGWDITVGSRHLPQKGNSMKSYRKELWFDIPTRRAFLHITPHLEECLRESGIR